MAGRRGAKQLRRKVKRAKKSVRRGSQKAKRRAAGAAKTLKQGAAKAKKKAARARKAVKRATKKAKKTARRAKKAVSKAAKKIKRKARKTRIAQASADRAAAHQAIADAHALFADAIHRSDPTAIATIYSEEATLLPPSHALVRGREAIREYWADVMSRRGVTNAALNIVELDVKARRAEELGRYALSAQGDVIDEGKFVAIWQPEPGRGWHLRVSIWNSDRPPQT